MTSIAITVPKSVKDYLEELASEEGYSDVSELMQSVILELQKVRAKKMLDEKILQGIRSSKVQMTPKRWLALEKKLFGKNRKMRAR
jgi:Arc/MetJ-type ribon-helix-helix transcriptional regulator